MITRLKLSTIEQGLPKYRSMLAGNPAYTTAYESIATTTVGAGGSATITFSSIPSTYTHLQIRGIARGNIGAAGDRYVELTVNSDGATNYNRHELYGDGSTTAATGNATVSSIYSAHYPSNGDTANCFGVFVIDILDYANTSKNKTIRSFSGWDANGSGRTYLSSGAWRNTSAITSITLAGSADFAQYTTFALYGIKVAS